MGDRTGITWTEATWNPVTGCEEVSPGCDLCYAKTLAERFRGKRGHYFENGFDLQLRPDRLGIPIRWTRPRMIFVNSMSDLFHKDIPDEYIADLRHDGRRAPAHVPDPHQAARADALPAQPNPRRRPPA
jgi:protein gp37